MACIQVHDRGGGANQRDAIWRARSVSPRWAKARAAAGAALAPRTAPQMYLNFAETQNPAAPFWTGQAYQRLRWIKADVDPGDMIRSNHPVPPAR